MRGNLGAAETRWGQFERAMALITGALATQQAIGDRGSQGYSHWQLMSLHDCLGDLAAALRHGEQTLAVAAEVRDRGLENGACTEVATIAIRAGALDAAAQWLDRRDRLAAAADGAVQPHTLLPRAMLAQARGHAADAERQILAWLEWLEQSDGSRQRAECQHLWLGCKVLRQCALQAPYERVLARAWRMLQHDAAQLPEARRAAFLHNVPYNRAIAEAWAVLHPGHADTA
jgi:hypothetical protein